MAYTYQHYPLAMYRNGVYRAVANEAEEAEAAAEGFTDYVSDREGKRPSAPDVPDSAAPDKSEEPPLPGSSDVPAKRKPGRPKKA